MNSAVIAKTNKPIKNLLFVGAATAVLAAFAPMHTAHAAPVPCPTNDGWMVIVDEPETNSCVLLDGQSVTVTETGVINDGFGNAAILVDDVNVGNITIDGSATSENENIIQIQGASRVTDIIINEGGELVDTRFDVIYVGAGSEVNLIQNHGVLATAANMGGAGIHINGGQVSNIYNQATGQINVFGDGIYVNNSGYVSGDILNYGNISAGSYVAINVDNSNVAGTIGNYGVLSNSRIIAKDSTIGSIYTGDDSSISDVSYWTIDIDGSNIMRGLDLGGDIHGSNAAIVVRNSSEIVANGITLRTDADIQGVDAGLHIDYSTVNGDITNNGYLGGGGAGLRVESSAVNNTIVNNGTIEGAIDGGEGFAMHITAGSSVYSVINYDTITTADQDTMTDAVVIEQNSIIDTFENQGTIHGGDVGMYINGARVGNITNSGSILAGGTHSIYINAPTDRIIINNSGTLDKYVRITGSTLNLLDGTVLTGSIEGEGGILNIDTNFGTSADYDASGGMLNQINILANRTFTAQTANWFVTEEFNNNGTFSLLAQNTVFISGNYHQTGTGSILSIQAESANAHSKLAIEGNAIFDAGTGIFVDVADAAVFSDTDVLETVVSVTGNLTATTFNVTDNSYLYDFKARVNERSIDLLMAKGSTPDGGETSVSKAVKDMNNAPGTGAAKVLDSIFADTPTGDMTDVRNAFASLPTEAEVSDAVSQTLPTLTGGSTGAIMNTMSTTSQIVQARVEQNTGLSSGDEGFVTNGGAWLKPFGTWSNQNTDKGVTGFKADTYGLIVGADTIMSDDLRLGLAVSYANTDVKSTDHRNKLDVNSYQATLYGSYTLTDVTELSFQLNGGFNKNDSKRTINFGGLNREAKGSYDSYSFQIGTGIGHVVTLGEGLTIAPAARIDYSYISNDSYTETGAGALNLHVKSQSSKQLVPMVSAKLTKDVSDGFSVTVNAGVGYDLINDRNSATSNYVGGGASFVTEGLKSSPWLARTGAGLTYNAGAYDLTLRYDREDRGGFDAQTASIRARMPF